MSCSNPFAYNLSVSHICSFRVGLGMMVAVDMTVTWVEGLAMVMNVLIIGTWVVVVDIKVVIC